MCRAEPREVLQLDDGRAQVLYDGEPRWVAANGMPALVPGDYVVVYAGEAIELMDRDEAEDILRFNAQLEQMLEEAST
ncbi:MAG: HypC/HybG/HupF family hydrogenase formation chaperone [Chloroflexi bacterium]|nr:HypC/HybG/HupF family hydrogenase formation chaperone [Chloroflexota bacterium]